MTDIAMVEKMKALDAEIERLRCIVWDQREEAKWKSKAASRSGWTADNFLSLCVGLALGLPIGGAIGGVLIWLVAR